MSVTCPPHREPRAARERGQAMMLTVLLLAVGVVAVVYNFATPAKQSIERDKITAASLAQAKAALIGYALSVDVTPACAGSNCPRIGDLPCPDLDNDGDAEGSCGSADGSTGQSQRLGRLPWKTLGLPDLRDGYGERLWYAVSTNFKNNVRADCSTPGTATCRNSDIRGTITVRDRTGTTVHDGTNPDPYVPSGGIAVILAAGPILRRSDGTVQDRSAAGQNNPVNYLDVANVGGNEDNANFVDSNANGFINGPILDASGSAMVNDRLIVIRYDDIMPSMERRVAGEALRCLASYASANNGRYPWAAPFGAGYADDAGQRLGRFPDAPLAETVPGDVLPALQPAVQADCAVSPSLCMGSSWPASPACNFAAGTWWRNWKEQVFYGVADAYAPHLNLDGFNHPTGIPPGGPCGTCLTVNPPSTPGGKQVVVIVAGKILATPPQQRTDPVTQKTDPANYLESIVVSDTYAKAPRSSTFNDTVYYK